MIEADLILRGARLLTLGPLKDERPRVGVAAGDVGAVNDGFVAARDGMIVATGHGRTHERFTRVEGALDKDVGGRVVMPGFVDPHTHLCYAGERWEEFATRRSGADYLAVLAAGGGIHATVRATREASDDQVLALLRRRIGDAAELGTTTIEVKSGYGLEPEEELRQLRLLARAKAEAPIGQIMADVGGRKQDGAVLAIEQAGKELHHIPMKRGLGPVAFLGSGEWAHQRSLTMDIQDSNLRPLGPEAGQATVWTHYYPHAQLR